MNRVSLIFLGIFFALAFSFTGLVLTNHISYGALTPYFDENDGKAFPESISGVAQRGKLVYQDLGCVYCHTQQVRRPGFGSDIERKWGARQSVARDYVREARVLIGDLRIGPDLRNVGAREHAGSRTYDAAWFYQYLYAPQIDAPDTTQPPYAFLFETRKIVGQPSPKALKLPANLAAQPGYEIVPTERADALVAYLLSLKDTYAYPETKNVYAPPAPKEGDAKKEGSH